MSVAIRTATIVPGGGGVNSETQTVHMPPLTFPITDTLLPATPEAPAIAYPNASTPLGTITASRFYSNQFIKVPSAALVREPDHGTANPSINLIVRMEIPMKTLERLCGAIGSSTDQIREIKVFPLMSVTGEIADPGYRKYAQGGTGTTDPFHTREYQIGHKMG